MMKHIAKEIFKAIHEGLWLDVDYRNKDGEETKYWIAIKGIDPLKRILFVDGIHLGSFEIKELIVNVKGIQEIKAIDGTYTPIQEDLIEDIHTYPEKYSSLFPNTANLSILNYYSECYKLDNTPYKTNFSLIEHIDDESLRKGTYHLTDEQFLALMRQFYTKTRKSKKKTSFFEYKQIALNQMSIPTKEGLYVLAYQPVSFDIKEKALRMDKEIIIPQEFTIDGKVVSIKRFLDEEDLILLEDFPNHIEEIRNRITKNTGIGVDDMPYLLEISRDHLIDLDKEYQGILDLYAYPNDRRATPPLEAFFGNLTSRSRRRTSFPIALLNKKVNLDQLNATNHALRYPVSYVQGPPGTGKTQTIINTIISCFFNERTVLFSSYNNHPIDEVRDKLTSIQYRYDSIPFPIARLGNNEEIAHTLKEIRRLFEFVRNQQVFKGTLEKNKKERTEQAKKLTNFLQQYEEKLDLLQKKEALESMLSSSDQMNFQISLQTDQLPAIEKRLLELGNLSNEDALSYIDINEEELKKFLYYTSITYLKRMTEPKNEDLRKILYMDNEEAQVIEFNRYLSKTENLKKFMRIFPVIATTCLGARKLGKAEPHFDITIIDEAGQCNTAVTLIPILRGYSLMLVGDPQQLQPVIQLNENDNQTLMKKYNIAKEYDYIQHSVYQTFLACDPISDEVLLSYHYRCDPKIIAFNNKKYYNKKLKVASSSKKENPLLFIDIPNNVSDSKNTSYEEVKAIQDFLKENPNESIGVITPFVKQKEILIDQLRNYPNLNCGTVHAFQGDEKDIILFSLAITDKTRKETYDWLKNNQELINVATSRAKQQLVLVGSTKEVLRLHNPQERDDLFELIEYVRSQNDACITARESKSRALGVKPYSSETEAAFLMNLNHALDNAFHDGSQYTIHKEVPISQVFTENPSYIDFFYKGRFDFVIYHKSGNKEMPILAIELDGKEHRDDVIVQNRDAQKNAICKEHGFDLIRVENVYARRYHYMKDILIQYFQQR